VPLTVARRLASRCQNVLVKKTTKAIDPDDLRAVRSARHLCDLNWRLLAKPLVWAGRLIVVDELLHMRGSCRGPKINRWSSTCLRTVPIHRLKCPRLDIQHGELEIPPGALLSHSNHLNQLEKRARGGSGPPIVG